jgi:hypothetical protein
MVIYGTRNIQTTSQCFIILLQTEKSTVPWDGTDLYKTRSGFCKTITIQSNILPYPYDVIEQVKIKILILNMIVG